MALSAPTLVSPLMLTYFINYENLGWSEKWCLKESVFAPAIVIGAKLCLHRASVLAKGAQIVFAQIHTDGKPKDAKVCITGPIDALNSGPPTPVYKFLELDSPMMAAHIRFETPSGLQMNKLHRGVGDDEVSAFEFTDLSTPAFFPISPPGVDPANPTFANSPALLYNKLFGYILDRTQYVRRLRIPPLPLKPFVYSWQFENWERAIFRKASNRKTGRPFGLFRGRGANKVW